MHYHTHRVYFSVNESDYTQYQLLEHSVAIPVSELDFHGKRHHG